MNRKRMWRLRRMSKNSEYYHIELWNVCLYTGISFDIPKKRVNDRMVRLWEGIRSNSEETLLSNLMVYDLFLYYVTG